ncbi:hypothetical protein L4C42_03660 [Vibrio wakamikoensis]|jgi:hypothetical protein|uniref:DUF4148 domain-containing protein n=1 Tax=Vibrio chaetopteri TaxID=3016528 RepID=A0AAU8BF94_9VIBR
MRAKLITLTIIASAVSFTATSQDALDYMTIQSIKSSMSKSDIEQALENWRSAQLENIEVRARYVSDRAPSQYVIDTIEDEYQVARQKLGL